jgi:50S ribosomal protein L16 3-hydroxylase
MQLTNFDPAHFLRDAWQKKPLLIRNPWAAWSNPLSPDELAGLACEAEVESRLITQDAGKLAAENGPLREDRFGALGRSPWTLLVQAVDHYVPKVAALIEPFRFIPNWRIDDVMVSYATDGGGVGAHFDQYDVFLIQGLGRRRWQVGGYCDENSPLLPHDDLRLLADFEITDEWVLEPGDILYVPPGFAHNGIAVGDDCMTFSVGFRAPSRGEMLEDYCDHLIETLAEEQGADDRYADPDLALQANPGEIAPAAIAKLHAMVTERLRDEADFARWFGRYNSTPKYPEMDFSPEEPLDRQEFAALIREGTPLSRNPASRFSFIRGQGDALSLFADGAEFSCEGDAARFAEALCAGGALIADPGLLDSFAGSELLNALLAKGSLAFEDDDAD